jgi:hypothetical protein
LIRVATLIKYGNFTGKLSRSWCPCGEIVRFVLMGGVKLWPRDAR